MQKPQTQSELEYNIGDLIPVVVTLAVAGLVAAFTIDVLSDTRDDFVTNVAGCNSTAKTSCGVDYNATGDAIDGVEKIPSKLPLIATVAVAAVIIGLLLTYFMGRLAR